MSYLPIKKIIVCTALVCSMLGFSFAQNADCTTCGSTAQPLQLYIDMVGGIMSTMQTQAPQGPMVGAYNTPGLFGGGILELDNESRDVIQRSLEAIGRSIDQKVQATAAVTTILFTNVRDISRDNLIGLSLLAQNQAIVRDRAKIQRLGSLMQDKMFELALSTAWQSPLSVADREQIKTILDAYKDNELLVSGSVGNKATYANTIFVFQRINRSMERFLSYGSVNQLDTPFFAGGDDGIYIRFNKEKMEQMKLDYQCARFGDQCAGNFKQFVTDMETMGSENVQAARDSGRDVADAMKKLAALFKNVSKQTQKFLEGKNKNPLTQEEKDAALSRQDQLLRSVYGSDFKMLQTAILPTIRSNVDTSAFEAFKQGMLGFSESVHNEFKDLRELSKTDPTARNIKTIPQINLPGLSEVMQDSLRQTMVAVHNTSIDMMQYTNTTEPHNVVIYVPLLASQLDTLRSLIGTKDSKGMVIHNLGTACELQCSNAGGRCWW